MMSNILAEAFRAIWGESTAQRLEREAYFRMEAQEKDDTCLRQAWDAPNYPLLREQLAKVTSQRDIATAAYDDLQERYEDVVQRLRKAQQENNRLRQAISDFAAGRARDDA